METGLLEDTGDAVPYALVLMTSALGTGYGGTGPTPFPAIPSPWASGPSTEGVKGPGTFAWRRGRGGGGAWGTVMRSLLWPDNPGCLSLPQQL